MNVKEIAYRRIYNVGNYQSITIELRADISAEEDVTQSLNNLKNLCDEYYRQSIKGGF